MRKLCIVLVAIFALSAVFASFGCSSVKGNVSASIVTPDTKDMNPARVDTTAAITRTAVREYAAHPTYATAYAPVCDDEDFDADMLIYQYAYDGRAAKPPPKRFSGLGSNNYARAKV